MAAWSILCDFDGTVSVDDVTDILLERFGEPGWQALEEDWRLGKISSRTCMQKQIALLKASKTELDAAIDEIRIDPAFPAFAREVRNLGWPISIVSDGLDYAIRRILSRHGIKDIPIFANHLTQSGNNTWTLASPNANTACSVDAGTCKCTCVKHERTVNRRVLLVGDGASDYCAAGSVDFVFAKYRLNEYCRTHSIHHTSILGFADAIELLPALADEIHAVSDKNPIFMELRADARR
jgi:2-hydroxy-3-keto-5-methylthiopentenyl-1-phosphate phosphatase